MSEIKVNKISPRTACGTTTLGDSGDTIAIAAGANATLGGAGSTITIPAGATITNSGTAAGFGATGAASWDTTVKTSGFTAVSGVGYFCNTTSGGFSVNLPAGTAGAVVAIKDYANTFDTGTLTLVQNGSDKIGGSTVNATLTTEGLAVTLVFVDSTQGWLVTDNGTQDTAPTAQYVTATGGTITTSGNFKIHTFTGPGTFCVSSTGNAAGSTEVSYMVVAGGGGAGYYYGAAGGGGGFREGKTPQCSYTSSPIACTSGSNNGLPVAVTSYPVTVGAGGPSKTSSACASPGTAPSGSNSTFSTITSAGGGGGSGGNAGPANGGNGGSGGGGGGSAAATGGSGNTPPVSPPQGNNGLSTPGGSRGGAGGGAIEAAGTDGTNYGGDGATTSINGTATAFAGGGGGSSPGAPGGDGGGGTGAAPCAASLGGVNTGGGQGGCANGGAGGSGIVIIRYKFQN